MFPPLALLPPPPPVKLRANKNALTTPKKSSYLIETIRAVNS